MMMIFRLTLLTLAAAGQIRVAWSGHDPANMACTPADDSDRCRPAPAHLQAFDTGADSTERRQVIHHDSSTRSALWVAGAFDGSYNNTVMLGAAGDVASAHHDSSTRSVLWVAGVFDGSYNNTVMLGAAVEISKASFSDVILGFLHYHNDSSFWFNNERLENATFVAQAVHLISGTGTQVLISIGGAGVNDFDNIAADWQSFAAGFPAALAAIGVAGFDLDIEGGDWQGETLANIIRLGAQHGYVMTITPPDIDPNGYWIDLINQTLIGRPPQERHRDSTAPQLRSPLSRVQIQTYASFPSPPSERVQSWAKALQGIIPEEQMPGFLVPGFLCSKVAPADVGAWVAAINQGGDCNQRDSASESCSRQQHYNVSGVFAYDYSYFRFQDPQPGINASAYSDAMRDALQLRGQQPP